MDVVTTMFDPSIPLTANEWGEWGDPRRPECYAWLRAYSPFDNVPPAHIRPPLLVTATLMDPRVSIHEPAKWVAKLRHTARDCSEAGEVLFRVEMGQGGHTGPEGRYAALEYQAEIVAFLLAKLRADSAPLL